MDYKKRLKICQSIFFFKNKENLVVQILDYSEKVANFAFFDFVVQRLNYKTCSLRAAMDWWLIVQRLDYKKNGKFNYPKKLRNLVVQRLNYKPCIHWGTKDCGF